MEEEIGEKTYRKIGRPPLPPEWRRVQIGTTVPLAIAEAIRKEHWKLNEIVVDGISHRRFCSENHKELTERIEKLAAILERTTRDKERYLSMLRERGVEVTTEED